MRDSDDLADDVKRGKEAQTLLDSPAFKSAMLSAKATLVNRFIESKYEEGDKREEVWLRLKGMEDFFEELTDIINSGNISTIELDNRSKDK